jgi:hypothetical protein
MVRWSGFANLIFSDNARLALARAVELAETDLVEEHPGAWLVEDRRIGFSLALESLPSVVEAAKRLLSELADQACEGEAFVETANPLERWVRRASAPLASGTVEATGDNADTDAAPTIRPMAS